MNRYWGGPIQKCILGKSCPLFLRPSSLTRILNLSFDKMGFGDLKTQAGLQALNTYLQDKSYIEG